MTMAKRFTDTAKWNEDWFLDLSNSHKLFYLHLGVSCISVYVVKGCGVDAAEHTST